MFQDIKRTFEEIFGWTLSILPLGRKTARNIFLLAVIALGVYFALGHCFLLKLFWVYLAIAAFAAFFFRDPRRDIVFADDEIACPADGKVLSVKTEDDPNMIVVRIFLSVFNVHIQRAPIDGKVGDVIYTKGSFAFANNPAADKNERNLIKFQNGDKFANIEQITGAIARRIEAWVKTGDDVKAGQKVGLIYFGSQVAIYMPKDKVRVIVKEGQCVQGGLTVLGLWK
ncbi:MAG: phosphatidylserine decarboxylase [Elusimicrobiota bacterium]|jgi:phosphatidylserine decarboxylase|nr:phosphatidylserine decarboxylase [Elusimicrobiota bacterium]